MTYFWDKMLMKTKIYYLMPRRLVVENFILQIITMPRLSGPSHPSTIILPFSLSKNFLNALLFHSSKQSI